MNVARSDLFGNAPTTYLTSSLALLARRPLCALALFGVAYMADLPMSRRREVLDQLVGRHRAGWALGELAARGLVNNELEITTAGRRATRAFKDRGLPSPPQVIFRDTDHRLSSRTLSAIFEEGWELAIAHLARRFHNIPSWALEDVVAAATESLVRHSLRDHDFRTALESRMPGLLINRASMLLTDSLRKHGGLRVRSDADSGAFDVAISDEDARRLVVEPEEDRALRYAELAGRLVDSIDSAVDIAIAFLYDVEGLPVQEIPDELNKLVGGAHELPFVMTRLVALAWQHPMLGWHRDWDVDTVAALLEEWIGASGFGAAGAVRATEDVKLLGLYLAGVPYREISERLETAGSAEALRARVHRLRKRYTWLDEVRPAGTRRTG